MVNVKQSYQSLSLFLDIFVSVIVFGRLGSALCHIVGYTKDFVSNKGEYMEYIWSSFMYKKKDKISERTFRNLILKQNKSVDLKNF